MKSVTCKQLGGACDKVFSGETFEEVAEQSKNHGMEMFMSMDEDHKEAMEEMREIMSEPEGLQKWMDQKRKEFDALPED